jgi:uncharacterized protein
MKLDAEYWIEKLNLQPHAEGGYFRQTYRADLVLPKNCVPGFDGARAVSTAIYFLLESENFSAFHRLRSDEIWHFYAGESVLVHVIAEDGEYSSISLGANPEGGEEFQAVVKAGCWFASEVRNKKSWALVGCTVSPGFDFADFDLAKREQLVRSYPQHRELIERLTRG